jgi:hypothetical protein
MNQEDTFDITIVPPDNSSSVPIYFGYTSPPAHLRSLIDMIDSTGHRIPDGCYSPAGSSAGSSTPETPYKPLLDLNIVNVNLQAGVNSPNFFERPQHQAFSSEGASPFSHGGLSPVTQSFGILSLSDGIPSSIDHGARAFPVGYEDSSQIFGEVPSESPSPSPGRQSLSPLIIPRQLQANQSASYVSGDPGYISDDEFMRSIFNFGDERSASSIDSRTPPSASHSEPSSLHTSWVSPPPSSATDLPHPLVSDTVEHREYRVQSIDGGLAQRRNTHSGGRSGFMNVPGPDRGRQDERASPSLSSSRRSSPYPSHHHHHHPPGLSSSSLSPHSAIDSSHLSVPDREFFGGLLPGDAVRRRHSFTQTGRPAETPFLHSNETNLSLSSTSAERPIRKVASQAGIKASEARRTKDARFVCVWCNQTFTTNHNLKSKSF